ncbi:hypothetical protein NMY22_g11291 [Coprinellus aureogranulatus]|nr:hypothetical protein NMY22_g11291 [Coprinellus aureogranulatus]
MDVPQCPRSSSFLQTTPPEEPHGEDPNTPWDESEFGAAKSRLSDEDFQRKYLGYVPHTVTGVWSIYSRGKLEAFLMRYLKHERNTIRRARGEAEELREGRKRAMCVAAEALDLTEEEADEWMREKLEKWHREVEERYKWVEEVELSAQRIVNGPSSLQ